MIDPVSAGIAVALLGGGWLIGRFGRLRRQPKPLPPVCLCNHHHGTHDPETGVCRTQFKERFRATPGADRKDVWVSCPCVRYTGPQPVEQYWVAPSADLSIVTAPRRIEE